MYSAAGAFLFLSTGGLSKVTAGVIGHGQAKNADAIVTGEIGTSDTSFVSIRVVYLEMAQYVDTNDEYFVLRNPVTVQDVMRGVAQRHSSISSMMQSMWVLVNGMPSKPSALLKDGDEVDLVPLVSGG